MGEEQKANFTPVTDRQFTLLKGLNNASRTMAVDPTMDRTIQGWEEGSKRELASEGLGGLAEEVVYHSRDTGWRIIGRDGKVRHG